MSTTPPAKTTMPLTQAQRSYYNAQGDQLKSNWSQAQQAYGTWNPKTNKWIGNGVQGSQIGRDYTTQVNNLGVQKNTAITQLRGQLSGRGTATSPMFAGQGISDISNQWLSQKRLADNDKLQKLTAISQLRTQAQADYTLGQQQLSAQQALTQESNPFKDA